MTLYFWMHWFWITLWMYFVHGDSAFPLILPSTNPLPDSNTSNNTARRSKAIGIVNFNPPSDITHFNLTTTAIPASQSTSTINISKPSIKRVDSHFANDSMKLDTNKAYFNKDMTVISQNLTDIGSNISDSQTLVNINSTAINHSDNFTYIGDDLVFNNQSFVAYPEKISELGAEYSGNLTAASITGITLGCVLFVGLICGGSYILYRNRGFNRPQVLNDRCSNPDSSGYIDDASVRDNSEEMYSLDNDSFLNSLEAMTIQNYWTDTVKHTKL